MEVLKLLELKRLRNSRMFERSSIWMLKLKKTIPEKSKIRSESIKGRVTR